MATKKKTGSKKTEQNAATLTLANVKALATSLLDVADRYPTAFVTEVDFYPLVVAFLSWKLKGLEAEASLGGHEAIDFKVGKTTNPAYLELAVAPRVLGDIEDPKKKKLPNKTQLYGSANASELDKLSRQGGATKGRFLLLLDLRKDPHDLPELEKTYRDQEAAMPGPNKVKVVYSHRSLAEPAEIDLVNPKAKAGAKKGSKKGSAKTTKAKTGTK